VEGEDLMRALLASALVLFASAPDPAGVETKSFEDPATCPWCHNDPELLKKAGLVNHGPFPYGKFDTAKVHEILPECDIRWVETEHFRIGFGLGAQKVKLEEKKKILAELTRLKEFFPDVKPEIQTLDPWMRTHLYAQRCEDIYKHFIELMKIGDKRFKGAAGGQTAGGYMGEGQYLGMREKYEVLVLPKEAAHLAFLMAEGGLPIRMGQRWHFIERGAISIICHAQQGRLRTDQALHGHIAFNLAHNLLDGLNHYSYDTPVWFHEGLAHFMEREVDPDYNSFDAGEGSTADTSSKSDWRPEVLKLITTEKAPRLAELLSLATYAELKLPHHFTTWSMVDFLIKEKPAEFAKFIWLIKNNLDEKGLPTGANLAEWHRKAFKEAFGWNYQEFDDAWKAWAKEAYKPGIPKGGDGNPIIPGRSGLTPGG
jgi:glutaredoxin